MKNTTQRCSYEVKQTHIHLNKYKKAKSIKFSVFLGLENDFCF